MPGINSDWRKAVFQVGDGRGFTIADYRGSPLVVSAARCLPRLPTPHGWSDLRQERTHALMVGRLATKPIAAADVLFADPLADIAILGAPNNQADPQEEREASAKAYNRVLDGCTLLPQASLVLKAETLTLASGRTIQGIPVASTDAWMMDLAGEWFRCQADVRRGRNGMGAIWVSQTDQPVVVGMSGSPIITRDGVIGLVSRSNESPQPYLPFALPGWVGPPPPEVRIERGLIRFQRLVQQLLPICAGVIT